LLRRTILMWLHRQVSDLSFFLHQFGEHEPVQHTQSALLVGLFR